MNNLTDYQKEILSAALAVRSSAIEYQGDNAGRYVNSPYQCGVHEINIWCECTDGFDDELFEAVKAAYDEEVGK